MLNGRLPQNRCAWKDRALHNQREAFLSPIDCNTGCQFDEVSEQCKAVLRECLAIDPMHRSTMIILLEYEWLEHDGSHRSCKQSGSINRNRSQDSPRMVAGAINPTSPHSRTPQGRRHVRRWSTGQGAREALRAMRRERQRNASANEASSPILRDAAMQQQGDLQRV